MTITKEVEKTAHKKDYSEIEPTSDEEVKNDFFHVEKRKLDSINNELPLFRIILKNRKNLIENEKKNQTFLLATDDDLEYILRDYELLKKHLYPTIFFCSNEGKKFSTNQINDLLSGIEDYQRDKSKITVKENVDIPQPRQKEKFNFFLSITRDFNQIFGLLVVQFTFLQRRFIFYFFQLCLPLLCLLYIEIIQQTSNAYLKPVLERNVLENEFSRPQNVTQGPYMLERVQSGFAYYEEEYPSKYMFYSPQNDIGWLYMNGSRSGLLGNVKTKQIFHPNPIHFEQNIYFTEMYSINNIDNTMYSNIRNDTNDFLGAYYFNEWTDDSINYIMQYEQYKSRREPLINMLSKALKIKYNYSDNTEFCQKIGFVFHSFECENFLASTMMNNINAAFIKNSANRIVETKISHVPFVNDGFEVKITYADKSGILFFPLIVILLLPIFLYQLVLDKETRVRELMSLMGLKHRNYILANWIGMFLLYSAYSFCFYMLGRFLFQFRYFTQTDPFLMLVILVISGVYLISFSFLFSAFLKSTVIAIILGYFVVLSLPSFLGLLENQTFSVDNEWYFKLFMFFFPMPIVELIYYTSEPVLGMNGMNFDALFINFDVILCVLFILFDCVVYFVLYLYFEKVLPQPVGIRKPPWFIFDPVINFIKLKIGRKKREKELYEITTEKNEDSSVRKIREKIESNDAEYGVDKNGIVVKCLVKKFPNGVVAVKGTHFAAKQKECFGLLGQNGAGKTTTIRMLCGQMGATFGTAFVDGNDIRTDMPKIRQKISLCAQFDLLYGDLTCREHLLLYSRIKNIPLLKQYSVVDNMMKKCKLNDVKEKGKKVNWFKQFFERRVCELNAGLRRRTSIGISLIGNPRVLFLDEPTTGLDTLSKRSIWSIVQEEKKNRTIILTTHSMEEAEILCDNIGIMIKGSFATIGSPVDLKIKFGSGFTLKIHYKKMKMKMKIIKFVRNLIKSEKRIIRDFGKIIVWSIPKLKEKISHIFKKIEANKKKRGIVDFSLQQASLEDVFLNLMEKSIKNQENHDKFDINDDDMINDDDELSDNDENGNKNGKVKAESEELLEKNSKKTKFFNNFVNGLNTFYWQLFILSKKNILLSIRNWFESFIQIILPCILVLMLFLIFFTAKLDPHEVIHPSIENLETIPSCKPFSSEYCYTLAYATNNNSFAEMVMDEVISYNNIQNTKKFISEDSMLLFIKNNPNVTQIAVSFNESTFEYNYNYTCYTLYFNSTTLKGPRGDLPSHKILIKLQHEIDNAIFYISKGRNVQRHAINTAIKSTPTVIINENPSKYDTYYQLASCFFCLTGIFVIIFANDFLINERTKNYRQYLKINGMKLLPYWASNILLFVIFEIAQSIAVVICCYLFFMPMVWNANIIVVICLFVFYSFAILSFSLIFNIFLKNSRIGLIFDFLLAISIYFVSIMLDGTLIYSIYTETNNSILLLFISLLFPPFNFAKIYSDITFKTVPKFNYELNKFESNVGYTLFDIWKVNVFEDLNIWAPASIWSFLFLILNSLIFLSIYIYVDYIVSEKLYPWFFFLPSYWRKSSKTLNNDDIYKVENHGDEMPDDIKKELELLKSEPNEYNIRIVNLKKHYRNVYFQKNQAVNEFTLGVRPNESIVLLGNNGAGKTSTLNSACGFIKKNGGKIFVRKYDLDYNLEKIQHISGNCNQYDIIYPKLTAKEHLELFAVFKGIKMNEMPKEIDRKLLQVDLLNDKNHFVGGFSGGMKRRLSVAISVISNPRVLLLDEPSTGMDPFSKREVWRLIHKIKKFPGRSVIITSHEMAEAEELSSRIGIVVKGKLAALGNYLYLKNKFGVGYNLILVTNKDNSIDEDDDVDEIMNDFVMENVKNAKRIAAQAGSYIYSIPSKSQDDLIKFLEILEVEKRKRKGKVQNFSISKTTLEEVFLIVTSSNNEGVVKDGDEKDDFERIRRIKHTKTLRSISRLSRMIIKDEIDGINDEEIIIKEQ